MKCGNGISVEETIRPREKGSVRWEHFLRLTLLPTEVGAPGMAHRLAGCCYNLVQLLGERKKEKESQQRVTGGGPGQAPPPVNASRRNEVLPQNTSRETA